MSIETVLLFGAVGSLAVGAPVFAHCVARLTEIYQRGRRTPEERRLDEIAESAIRRAQEVAQERFGRFGR